MRILFISQYYPPEIGAASNRIGYFAQYLAKAGCDVSVLTGSPNYPEGKLYEGFANKFTIKNENGVQVTRTRIFLVPKKTAFKRLLHYLSFVVSSFLARAKIDKPDVIIATSPPLFVGIIGVIFKKLWRAPLIMDIRDIWPQSVESVGIVKNKKLLSQGEKLANWIYKNADKITATSDGIRNNLPENSRAKTAVIPNGAEIDLFAKPPDAEKIKKMWGAEGKFVVLYTGNLGLAQAPDIFTKTAEILKNENEIVFLIVGAGVELPRLQEAARKKNLTNIIFAGNRPRVEMPGFIAAADVCVIPYKAAKTFRNTLPSKMFDYMAGGKPIIINLKGEASELIEKAQCGLLSKEENAQDTAKIILELKNNARLTEQMGHAGKEFVEKNYRREVIAKDLQKIIEKELRPPR